MNEHGVSKLLHNILMYTVLQKLDLELPVRFPQLGVSLYRSHIHFLYLTVSYRKS